MHLSLYIYKRAKSCLPMQALMLFFSGWIGLCVGFPLHMIEHTISLVITLLNNTVLCNVVELEHASSGKRFAELCEGLTYMLLPYGTLRDMVTSPISPARQCAWSLSWMQITFGYFASCFLVYRNDFNARHSFESALRRPRREGQKIPLSWVLRWTCIVGLWTWSILQALNSLLDIIWKV